MSAAERSCETIFELAEDDIEVLQVRIAERHRLAERFLVDVLGLGWAEAHDAAANWHGVIDDRTERRWRPAVWARWRG